MVSFLNAKEIYEVLMYNFTMDNNDDDEHEFSGSGVVEYNLDLNTDRLRSMSPDDLERYLRQQIKKRRKLL